MDNDFDGVISKSDIRHFLTDVLGIKLYSENQQNNSKEDDLVKLLIELRTTAKQEKNYSLADDIRSKLNEIGVTLEDSKEGTTYKISRK